MISVERAAECIGRQVFWPASGDEGVIDHVNVEHQKVYVRFGKEENAELVDHRKVNWVSKLTDADEDWLGNYDDGYLETGSVDGGDFFINQTDGGGHFIQLKPSASPNGTYLDILWLDTDGERVLLLVEDVVDQRYQWDVEEALGWKAP